MIVSTSLKGLDHHDGGCKLDSPRCRFPRWMHRGLIEAMYCFCCCGGFLFPPWMHRRDHRPRASSALGRRAMFRLSSIPEEAEQLAVRRDPVCVCLLDHRKGPRCRGPERIGNISALADYGAHSLVPFRGRIQPKCGHFA